MGEDGKGKGREAQAHKEGGEDEAREAKEDIPAAAAELQRWRKGDGIHHEEQDALHLRPHLQEAGEKEYPPSTPILPSHCKNAFSTSGFRFPSPLPLGVRVVAPIRN